MRPRCATGWRLDVDVHSTFALCIPRGFEGPTGPPLAWGRADPGRGAWSEMLAVHVTDTVPEEFGFPRTLHSWTKPRDCADCYLAESLLVVSDTIDGRLVPIQTALLTGGESGARRLPGLYASWQVGRRWVMVKGTGATRRSLDSLRAILRTLRVRGDSASAATPLPGR